MLTTLLFFWCFNFLIIKTEKPLRTYCHLFRKPQEHLWSSKIKLFHKCLTSLASQRHITQWKQTSQHSLKRSWFSLARQPPHGGYFLSYFYNKERRALACLLWFDRWRSRVAVRLYPHCPLWRKTTHHQVSLQKMLRLARLGDSSKPFALCPPKDK